MESEVPIRIKRRNPINRAPKLNIVFDAKARKEYLTGFRKRKLGRQKKAQEELNARIKKEKKRIKEEGKYPFQKFKVSYQPIPEVEELLKQTEVNYDYGDQSVSVVEVNNDFLQQTNNCIGENKVMYAETDDEGKDENSVDDHWLGNKEFKSIREIKKDKGKIIAAELMKSKAFLLRNRLQQKQRKKAKKERHFQAQNLKKYSRRKHKILKSDL